TKPGQAPGFVFLFLSPPAGSCNSWRPVSAAPDGRRALPAGGRSSLDQGRCAVRPGAARRAFARTRGSAAQAVRAHPALTRAQDIHVLLAATPGRQCAAHLLCEIVTPVPMAPGLRWAIRLLMTEATKGRGRWTSRSGGCGKQRMDALRRRVSHGWLTEPGSNPRTGTASIRKPPTPPDRWPSPLAL